ncbi:hypothetical protein Dda_6297 [Drechslerella dactyloides]|uniref:Uncharacterized protein n=1 Tax=Drechslerella dactyloides TaxID=74499 RepID=A0AAD6IZI5_DREDA|nr:hypothetical protein Dda_6297 [Drechslerella dactyloides]
MPVSGAAKLEETSVPTKRQPLTIKPGLPTPIYPDGGWFTVKSSPVTIVGSKEQIIQTLLKFDTYHTWNNFIPRVTNIVDPPRPNSDSDPTSTAPSRGVGTTIVMHARLFASIPFFKVRTGEEVTTINKEAGIVAWRARTVECERVHVITEAEYGTCQYQSFETFQKTPMTILIRLLLSIALKMRFDEWGQDLKAAVEAQNW